MGGLARRAKRWHKRAMNAVTPSSYVPPADPSLLGWPATFPIEVALAQYPIKEICLAHNVDQNEWNRLRADEGFQNVVSGYLELLKKDGMSFKLKAMMQSEELLKTSWDIIHGVATPAAVKADLIKNTWRVAGLDASLDQKNGGGNGQNNAFQIILNLA